jgi:dTDP-4-dehydrorhamnose 3,5-epimerase
MKKPFDESEGFIAGCAKDGHSITEEWNRVGGFIEGVRIREVKNVIKPGGGVLTEIYRNDWGLDTLGVDQIFSNLLFPGQISGWHVHRHVTDRIFVSAGYLKIVLYDARSASPTFRQVDVFCYGADRPALVLIPPGVWHAVQNLSGDNSVLLNIVDRAYQYGDPDHWRLPVNCDQIPYKF